MGHLMTALGAKVERVIINDLKNATYYARMIIRAENELQQKKIVELDGGRVIASRWRCNRKRKST
jgi:bifunctional DNase/RNase